MANIFKSNIFIPPHPQGHGVSVKCEQFIDGLTVQVWLLYHHPNFKYCTLFENGAELRTDGQTNGRTDKTDNPITICPRRTFQAGGIKIRRNINFKLTSLLYDWIIFRPFRRQMTGLVLNVSFWPELEHKMVFVYARKDDVAVASFWWQACNK